MQNFSRSTVPPPESLLDEQSRPAREALVAIFSEDDRTLEGRRVRMDRYAVDDGDLRQSLLRLFRGKCAFCEAMVETSPYRFRPPEEAGPSSSAPPEASHLAHLYYVWLVNDWSNIYPVCDDCRPLEPSIFPIRSGRRMQLPEPAQVEMYASGRSGTWPFPASELQVFLDPSGDENFRRNLVVAPDGRLFGSTERGEATVKHFNLDREDLVARRGGVFSENLGRLFAMGDPQAVDFGPFEFADMEFGGTWYLLLYQLAKAMSSGSSSAPRLSSGAIRDYFAQRIGAPNFRKQLQGTLRSFDENPYALIRSRKRTRVVMRGRARPVAFIIENFRSIDQLRLEMPARSSIRADDDDGFSADFGSAGMVEPDGLSPALMILGENAVGKSSILEAVAYLLAGDAARSDIGIPPGSMMLDPELLGGKGGLRPCRLAAEFEDGSVVELRIRSGEVSGEQGNDDDRTPVFAYGAFRIFAEEQGGRGPGSDVVSIFRPEHVLPNPEKWLVGIAQRPVFAEVRRALSRILAIDDEVDGIVVEDRRCLLVTSGTAGDGSRIEVRTPLNLVSSGFRSVLSMACHVIRGLIEAQDASSASLAKARAVVLIDEVEAHLHPRWKMRVVRGLREALPGVTFLMTTHDPLCLRGLSSGEIVVLRRFFREDSADLPSSVEQMEDLPPASALTVQQLLTSDFFDLFSTDEVATEITLARAGDLLASSVVDGSGAADLIRLRRSIRSQVTNALPIGSTEIERLVQEAVEEYLRERARVPEARRRTLRGDTRARIVDLLGRL